MSLSATAAFRLILDKIWRVSVRPYSWF